MICEFFYNRLMVSRGSDSEEIKVCFELILLEQLYIMLILLVGVKFLNFFSRGKIIEKEFQFYLEITSIIFEAATLLLHKKLENETTMNNIHVSQYIISIIIELNLIVQNNNHAIK